MQLLLSGLQNLNDKEQANMRHRHYCALMQVEKVTDSMQDMEQAARQEVKSFENAFIPNADQIQKNEEKQKMQQRIGKWEGRWGKMSDPEVKERIRRTAEAMRALREQTAREDAQSSLEGLMGMTGRQRRNVSR